ncbi:uncharacterized protein N7483_004816 [Penicillium malachiteum]|uniref:uncharacterized protein n=1 Tax=Penicillium malachiteum TaxID=1324776 RepID=UPI002549071C|nr:uncharacterized protein N7483_004816 [Penicillium malachiteum]KAJ5730308.1 hypothetical protein N7483_004816 [Penicillium malachiteum]
MFKALMGGGRSTVSSSSKSSRRRADSTKSSHSRKSSRGDDRDRGLEDAPYSPSASGSRRGPPSAAGDSVASSYVTAEPESMISPDRIIERTPKRRDSDRESKSSRRRARDRSESRERDMRNSSRAIDEGMVEDRDDQRDRRERQRTQPGAPYVPPISASMSPSAPVAQFATDMGAPGFSQFPGQYDHPAVSGSGSPHHNPSPAPYDPHVQQQFPGQFPTEVAAPYFPPNNPAGAAADYYGDQGQSVSEQPGIRPHKPEIIPNSQAHLMAASPIANPPPEPSSIGQVGAAASYFDDDFQVPEAPPKISSKPPKPGKVSSKPSRPSSQLSKPPLSGAAPSVAAAAAAGAAAYGMSSGMSSYQSHSESQTEITTAQHSTSYSQPAGPSTSKPPPPQSHGIGTGFGLAAAGAAAGYMLGHEHHPANTGAQPQWQVQNFDQPSPSGMPLQESPSAMPLQVLPDMPCKIPGFTPHGTGALAMRHRPQGPVSKFADFWRDPEGVGRFEDYTETIGVCKYCFEPGTTSLDAPRKHHYHARRHSSDRYSSSSSSRVDKLSRYHSSEDESRRRKRSSRSNKSSSWLPGMLAGGLFAGKEFKDSYRVRSSTSQDDRVSYDTESVSVSDRRSYTSRGVVRRAGSTHEQYYSDSKHSRQNRSRSRSRSSSQSGRHSSLKEAALGAAVGGAAALAVAKSHQRSRSRSPSRVQRRKESSSSSSFLDVSRPTKSGGGFTSFFLASSENRKKKRSKRKGFFSFNSSSSSSLDADLAFGTGFLKKAKARKSKKEGKKKKEEDVDAALLGLSATATALAASSASRRTTGQILASRESRSRHSNYASSAYEDEEWIDDESESQTSDSVESALAFGGSSADSSSDSGRGGWSFFGLNKKKSKKDKKKRSSATDAALAAGAGALGAAAITSIAHHRDSRVSSSDGSLQQVYPVATGDPTRFDATHVSPSVVSADQAPLVRPGPIPLQQPQPVTPVSQAVYTTQGGLPGSIPAYATSEIPPIFQHDRDPRRIHQRSDSFPVFPTQEPSFSALKRRSTTKDVSFALTDEQTMQQSRRERKSRDQFDQAVQLIDVEEEQAKQEKARREYERREIERQELERRELERRENERRDLERRDLERRELERREYERQEFQRQEAERQEVERLEAERQELRHREQEDEERRIREAAKEKESSRMKDIAIGAVGGIIADTVMSHEADDAAASEASSDRYSKRREKRRKEREQSRQEMESSVITRTDVVVPVDDVPSVEHEVDPRMSPSRRSPRSSPVYESYADFYAPQELRHSPDHDTHSTDQPSIVEVVPASERRDRQQIIFSDELKNGPLFGPEPYENRALPWEVPSLCLIKPTPDQSVNGSVTGAASPIGQNVVTEDPERERQREPEPEPQPEPQPQSQAEPEVEPAPEPLESPDPLYEDWFIISSKDRKKREKVLKRKGLPIPGKDGFELPSDNAPEPEPEVVAESEWKPQRSTTGSRVSWGHDKTHEYEVLSSSEHEPTDHDISPFEDSPKEFSVAESTEKSKSFSERQNFGEDIEFAAILAAGTQAAGFDSSVVLNDPKFHTRTSPPGSEDEGTFSSRSKWTEEQSQPQGFVVSEIESEKPSLPADVQAIERHVTQGEPFYSEPLPLAKDTSSLVESREPTSIAEKVMEELNAKSDRPAYAENDVFSMPGGFDTPEVFRDLAQYRDDSRSVFSAPVEREVETSTKSKNSRRSGDKFELLRDVAAPAAAATAAAIAAESVDHHEEEEKDRKKHRKRHSKRDSETFSLPDDNDDARSTVTVDDNEEKSERRRRRHRSSRDSDVASVRDDNDDTRSVVTVDDGEERSERRRRRHRDSDTFSVRDEDDDEKSERRRRRHHSSRDSDIVPVDDDAASAVTAPELDGNSERRKHRHRSSHDSGFDDAASITSSPARIDEREKRREKDDKQKSSNILRSLFGSRVSTTEKRSSSRTSSRSSSVDKRPSRDAVSEAGVDEERRRRKKHHRHHSSSGDKYDDYDSDKVSVKSEANLEEYRSKRQEKEEKRRQRYEDIVDSGRRRESEKV